MKDKAVALCRVSTLRQKLEGNSLEAQEKYVSECADYLNTEIVKMWSLDTSSKKGTNVARKDLIEIYNYCRQTKKIKYLVLDEVDRFMRSVDEYYWWKVEFKNIGVLLAYAKMPEITHEDNPMAVMKEMMAVFQAESSNYERITKTTDKMQSRILQGYYLSHPHQGYIKSTIPGIHIPDPDRFELLRKACKLIIYDQYTPPEAIKWLRLQGYLTKGGKVLDVNHFTDFIDDRYYCGYIDIKSDGWPKNVRGLHDPMLSEREHSLLIAILSKRNPRLRRKYNPDFPLSNIIRHEECTGRKYEKYTGFQKNRGKRNGKQRPLLPVYSCRDCKKCIGREKAHKAFRDYLASLKFSPSEDKFKKALLKVWRNQRGSVADRIRALETRKNELDHQLRKAGAEYIIAPNATVKQTLSDLMESYKADIDKINEEIDAASNVEMESESFVNFAFNFTQGMCHNWWHLSADDRKRGEQLLFNGKIYINNSATVHTPKLSSIYTLGTNKKAPEFASDAHLVELVGTAPTSAGLSSLVVYRHSSF